MHQIVGDPNDGVSDEAELIRVKAGIPVDARPPYAPTLAPGLPPKKILERIPADCDHCWRPPKQKEVAHNG